MRDLIVKLFVKLGIYKITVEYINRFKQFFQAKKVRKWGLENLREADAAFSEIGLQMFPAFGTLLGAVRDHGFISYDFDLDVGVIDDPQKREALHESMAKHGFLLRKQTYINDEEQTVSEETYERHGVGIDVFFYFSEGNDLYAYCPRKHEYKEWKEANQTDGFPVACSYVCKTDFVRQDFLGVPVNIPVKSHEWLCDIYSDSYMTPIKNWNPNDYKTRIVPSQKRCYRRYI